jgi:signal transduction histidine kinase
VEDNGPGIAVDVRDQVFEPFVTTKSVGEGTGLGLAVCRGLVESANGEIGLDATYEQGARFFIVLPASDV